MIPILREAAQRCGGMSGLAQSIGLTRSAIYQWKSRIPAERVMDVEAATGIDRARLRPDLYKADRRVGGKSKRRK
jgi:DNA-binding transcriptional regulator YdaS (Cro superfamily)